MVLLLGAIIIILIILAPIILPYLLASAIFGSGCDFSSIHQAYEQAQQGHKAETFMAEIIKCYVVPEAKVDPPNKTYSYESSTRKGSVTFDATVILNGKIYAFEFNGPYHYTQPKIAPQNSPNYSKTQAIFDKWIKSRQNDLMKTWMHKDGIITLIEIPYTVMCDCHDVRTNKICKFDATKLKNYTLSRLWDYKLLSKSADWSPQDYIPVCIANDEIQRTAKHYDFVKVKNKQNQMQTKPIKTTKKWVEVPKFSSLKSTN